MRGKNELWHENLKKEDVEEDDKYGGGRGMEASFSNLNVGKWKSA